MSPVLDVLSMKSSSLLENRLLNASSRVESPVLAKPPSPALPKEEEEEKPVGEGIGSSHDTVTLPCQSSKTVVGQNRCQK